MFALKDFSPTFIQALNAQSAGGIFCAAVALTLAPGTTFYYADVQAPVTFEGQVYEPLPLRFDNMGQTSQMEIAGWTVTVSNIDGQVGAYLEDHELAGLPVTIHILHLDVLGQATESDTSRMRIIIAEWGREHAIFHCGYDLALSEVLPRTLYNASEEPGVPEGLMRASIL